MFNNNNSNNNNIIRINNFNKNHKMILIRILIKIILMMLFSMINKWAKDL